jgi:hypothetical protein
MSGKPSPFAAIVGFWLLFLLFGFALVGILPGGR